MAIRARSPGVHPSISFTIPDMNWFNIPIASLRKPEFTSCEPFDLGIWLRLSCYCAAQENGGIIRNSRAWTDRQWLIACGVMAEDVSRQCALWKWSSTCLIVALYPLAKEQEVAAKRAAGKATAKARWSRYAAKHPPKQKLNGSSADSPAISSADSSDVAQRIAGAIRKGKRKGNEKGI